MRIVRLAPKREKPNFLRNIKHGMKQSAKKYVPNKSVIMKITRPRFSSSNTRIIKHECHTLFREIVNGVFYIKNTCNNIIVSITYPTKTNIESTKHGAKHVCSMLRSTI